MTITTTNNTSPTAPAAPALHHPEADHVRKLIQRRSYAVIATVSPAGYPHAAGVLYALAGDALVINTLARSRKARNIEASGRVGVTIPVRRVPVGGPPSAVQFQAEARVVAIDDPTITGMIEAGQLTSITGHGELELEGSRFVVIDLPARLHTYGIGMSLRSLISDPLGAGGVVEIS